MVASKLHCYYCFDVLTAHLNGDDPKSLTPPFPTTTERVVTEDDDDDDDDVYPATPSSSSSSSNTEPLAFPLFVTWSKVSSPPTSSTSFPLALRGCIGNFSPLPLDHGLLDYALIAATQDHRFPAIHATELPMLWCSVSLLTDFEPCAHPHDWQLGVHGIRITFTCPTTKRTLGATFLPEVAREQGWDHKRTLVQLVRKAGFGGPAEAVLGSNPKKAGATSIKVMRYQSRKARCSYAEYMAWVKAGRFVGKQEDAEKVAKGEEESDEDDVSSSV